jgi:hypothetical protein
MIQLGTLDHMDERKYIVFQGQRSQLRFNIVGRIETKTVGINPTKHVFLH